MKRPSKLSLSTVLFLAACGTHDATHRTPGQTSFISAPPGGGSGGAKNARGGVANDAALPPSAAGSQSPAPTRAVEETDLYRLEGDRLYYLNGYRGLMVFDVSDVDHPRLLGRSPIFGSPTEMLVRNGVATVVVADWFGSLDDGTPFHGSIVRGLDASDPTHIRVLGEAKLGGWVRDVRVVGDVLYAVSEDYGWIYGWGIGVADGVAVANVSGGGGPRNSVIVSSVSFAGGVIEAVGKVDFPGFGGIFNVTPNAILLAHDADSGDPNVPAQKTELLYLDISDPHGAIVKRGALQVTGRAQGWGPDNGRWNLDFADGKTAHVLGCSGAYWGCNGNGYSLATADFSNPDAPVLKSELAIGSTGWSVAARFDTNRLYLSPDSYSVASNGSTPLEVFDLSNPEAPVLAGTAQIPGTVWNILLAPEHRLFALGNDWNGQSGSGAAVSLKYLDVSSPTAPVLLGTSTFGQGWAWTPAAGTFKAFTMDAQKQLVVLPFSGWDYTTYAYNNGLQLIEFTPGMERTAGAAHTKGWSERGIFVKTRLVSLSDTALSVVDYTNHDAPALVTELTLARNVISARPQGATIAEVSSDWWDNDVSTSEVRVLPIDNAEETADVESSPKVDVEGVNAHVFRNGDLAYIVTNVRTTVPCAQVNGGNGGAPARDIGGGSSTDCFARAQQVQVVDTSNGGAALRGKVQLPVDPWGYGWWGWGGFYWYDWFDGAEVVQVGNDALAFRRWLPIYSTNGLYIDSNSALFVVDLSNPDHPGLASITITDDPNGWWGNMRMIGSTLYTSHYEWVERSMDPNAQWTARYYVDRIDLSDRAHPRVEHKINVPGLLIGGSETDPSLLYTIDYRWDSNTAHNDFDVVRIHGDTAELLSNTIIEGWVGNTFIVGDKAYMSAERYDDSNPQAPQTRINLHALDLSNPNAPVDRIASDRNGWGWLLDVEGDRAIVSSGWGLSGVDIYTLSDGAAPVFSQFVRTRGWWANEVSRQGSQLFLSSGYWGVQKIDLQ